MFSFGMMRVKGMNEQYGTKRNSSETAATAVLGELDNLEYF